MHAALLLTLAFAGNDDRDVIQAALLSFYKEEIWHAPDWRPKQPIQLLDEFIKDDGQTLERALREMEVDVDEAWAHLKTESKTQRDDDYLSYYARTSLELERILPLAKQKGAFVPARLTDFRKVKWDARIQIVDEIKRDYGLGPVSAIASKPRYSPSGRIAWVQFIMPWSIHSADVQFVLEKSKGAWRVVFGWAKFYV